MILSRLFVCPLFAETPAYDRATEVTLEGNALYVGEGAIGIFVVMKDHAAPNGQVNEVTVHLAPKEFLARNGIRIVTGDKVRIVGSRVIWHASETILAREVSVNGKTLALRDPTNR